MPTYINSWGSRLPQFPSAGILATNGTGLITSPQMLAMPTTTSSVGMVTINNVRALHFYGTNNAFLGSGSGNFTLTGTENFGAGTDSSSHLTSGASNCASGAYSLLNCTTSPGNCSFGRAALQGLTTGIGYNTAIGYDSLYQLNTGSYNLALGYLSGDSYTGAESSNILLRNSGVVGESNVMRLGTTGSVAGQVNKAFIAGITGVTPATAGALVNITDSAGQVGTITNGTAGWVLTSNGVAANPSFQAASSGGITTINGDSSSVTGATVTLTGGTSGAVFTGSGSTMTESFNFLSLPTTTATNGQILINSVRAFHTYGTNNTFVGAASGNFTTSGTGLNTALGAGSLSAISTGANNVAIGYNAGTSITTTSNHVCIGSGALSGDTNFQTVVGASAGSATLGSQATLLGYSAKGGTGVANTMLGYSAGAGISNGQQNCAIGASALGSITSGSFNTAWGGSVAYLISTGSYNMLGGYNSGTQYNGAESSNILLNNVGVNGESHVLRIGSGTGTGAQQLEKAYIHGIRGITTVNADAVAVLIDSAGQLGTVSSSIRFKENVVDIGEQSNALMSMRPVAFNYKQDQSKTTSYGLIAEEVNEVMPSLVVYDKEGLPETLKYHEMTALLLNEIQKLNKRIEVLEGKLVKA